MRFSVMGSSDNPVVLFFHAMGVNGESSERVAKYLSDKFYCIMPTSTVYCSGQKYIGKSDEIRQIEDFLKSKGVTKIMLVVASSIGADLAVSFLSKTKAEVEHAFFDGGQFAQIPRATRKVMAPLLYLAIKSLYWSKGKTLKKIMWCDDNSIKPYFVSAGRELTYSNLRRQLSDSLEDKPFENLPEKLQAHSYFEFGSAEEHFKYRAAVMKAYPGANYPVFAGHNHMQYQIKDPAGFANMLFTIVTDNRLPDLPFLKGEDNYEIQN